MHLQRRPLQGRREPQRTTLSPSPGAVAGKGTSSPRDPASQPQLLPSPISHLSSSLWVRGDRRVRKSGVSESGKGTGKGGFLQQGQTRGGWRERQGSYASPVPPLLSNPVPLRPHQAPLLPPNSNSLRSGTRLPWQQEGLHTRTLTLGCKRDLKGQLHLKAAYIPLNPPPGFKEKSESGAGKRGRGCMPGDSRGKFSQLSPCHHPRLSAQPQPSGKGPLHRTRSRVGVSLQEYTHTTPTPPPMTRILLTHGEGWGKDQVEPKAGKEEARGLEGRGKGEGESGLRGRGEEVPGLQEV